eukprot:11360400-Alexandrium_andersonii.AAC.1
MADCGLRRIAAQTGLERIVDCALGTFKCKDPSSWTRTVGEASASLSSSSFRAHPELEFVVPRTPLQEVRQAANLRTCQAFSE